MFDTNVYRAGDQHHYHRSEVHEHRAPTDESVRLLKEMEQKAEAKLLGSVRLDGCEVSCVVHHMREMVSGDHKFVIQYQLGNKRREVRHTFIPGVKSEHQEQERVATELLTALATDIGAAILAPAMDKALPRFKL